MMLLRAVWGLELGTGMVIRTGRKDSSWGYSTRENGTAMGDCDDGLVRAMVLI